MTGPAFNWREHLKVHPAAELFPLLPEAELKELADDIKANGLRTDIVTTWYPDDKCVALLDGRNRLDALALLGILCVAGTGWLATTKTWRGKQWVDDKGSHRELRRQYIEGHDPYALVLSYNIHRRHLSGEQKRELAAKVLKANPRLSDREIGRRVKQDGKTIEAIRTEMEGRAEIPHVDKRTDRKGRKQPAAKPKKEPKSQPASASQEPVESKAPVNAKDIALESFDSLVLELIHKTKGHKPQRFVKSAVPKPLLGDLAHFLREVIAVRKLEDDPNAGADAEAQS